MGVFKEEAHVFEMIARQQIRIYTDAADYGYPYNTNNVPQNIKNVFSSIYRLQDLDKKFPEEKNLVRNRQTWKGGVSVDVIIFWEKDEGYYRGTKYTISFNKTAGHNTRIDKTKDAFISIDITSHIEK